MYHQIRDIKGKEPQSGLAVSTGRFRRQMKFLKCMGYQGLSMTALLPYLKGEKQGKVVGITFDDGFLNNLTDALPVLDQLNFTATNYIVKDRMGATNDWNPALSQQPLMTRSQIQSWIDAGMEIGAHTLSHVRLAELSSEEAEREVIESKVGLEEMFGIPVNHFSYPYGSVDDGTVALAEKAGFQTATTIDRSRCLEGENLLRLPRVAIARRTMPHLFYMKVATRYEDKRRKPA